MIFLQSLISEHFASQHDIELSKSLRVLNHVLVVPLFVGAMGNQLLGVFDKPRFHGIGDHAVVEAEEHLRGLFIAL